MAVYYADSSVLVTCHVVESGTSWVQQLTEPAAGNRIITAHITQVEGISALSRRLREGMLPRAQYTPIADDWMILGAPQYQIVALSAPVVDASRRLLEMYPLRAYDAVQLATAVLSNQGPVAAMHSPLTFLATCGRYTGGVTRKDRMKKTIEVAAAVIRRDDGRILLARRAPGLAFAGKWEFPGGKIEAGETSEQCLARELREELAIEAVVGAYVCSSRTEYPNLIVEMHAYEVRYGGEKFHLTDHDAVAWVAPHELSSYEMPEADIPIVERLSATSGGAASDGADGVNR